MWNHWKSQMKGCLRNLKPLCSDSYLVNWLDFPQRALQSAGCLCYLFRKMVACCHSSLCLEPRPSDSGLGPAGIWGSGRAFKPVSRKSYILSRIQSGHCPSSARHPPQCRLSSHLPEKQQQCPVPCWLCSRVPFALSSKEGNELLGWNFLNGLHSRFRGKWEANTRGCGLKESGVPGTCPSHGSVVSPLKTSVAWRKK